ncbi:Hypothetical_protein [Hexamita inflata]|uniref:Hypothetical_protein n=1 Tax=Hexamita inflata TaxID=28002 RepID=A0AA86TEU6_9EUKA|nr:Hypothetical protein HINF_LOCUS1907 [Hexamita inflata]CAI9934710.1 Hypothetical protein HINF_LOCUS22355 [Hexamita inflata]
MAKVTKKSIFAAIISLLCTAPIVIGIMISFDYYSMFGNFKDSKFNKRETYYYIGGVSQVQQKSSLFGFKVNKGYYNSRTHCLSLTSSKQEQYYMLKVGENILYEVDGYYYQISCVSVKFVNHNKTPYYATMCCTFGGFGLIIIFAISLVVYAIRKSVKKQNQSDPLAFDDKVYV